MVSSLLLHRQHKFTRTKPQLLRLLIIRIQPKVVVKAKKTMWERGDVGQELHLVPERLLLLRGKIALGPHAW
jgi:hypothetical protein